MVCRSNYCLCQCRWCMVSHWGCTTTMLVDWKQSNHWKINCLSVDSFDCLCCCTRLCCHLYCRLLKGDIPAVENQEEDPIHPKGQSCCIWDFLQLYLFLSLKRVTHLPPYVGMMFSLAIVATFAEIFSATKLSITSIDQDHDDAVHHSPVHKSLSKIELPSILILLGNFIGCCCSRIFGNVVWICRSLNTAIPNTDIVIMLLGIGSAVIDNVPLVARINGNVLSSDR